MNAEQIAAAKAELATYVAANIPEASRSELSRLMAKYIAAIVRKERADAARKQRIAEATRAALDDTRGGLDDLLRSVYGGRAR